MSDAKVAAIRARREAINAYLDAEYPKGSDYRAFKTFSHQAPADIDYLLAALERAQEVVRAAEELLHPDVRWFLEGDTDAFGSGHGDEYKRGEAIVYAALAKIKAALEGQGNA